MTSKGEVTATGVNDGHADDCPVIGIGASAGGLNALKAFLESVPADSGMAFVIVQHLDPHHKSLLADILSRSTGMAVNEAEDGVRIAANQVYIIRPGKYLSLAEGRLRLSEPESGDRPRMPVDYFFRSLARARGNRAVAMLFSGTGSDGTIGLREIKAHEGLTLVQQPEDAEFDGMIVNAINAGLVDLILPVEQMPQKLRDHLQSIGSILDRLETVEEPANLAPIVDHLKEKTGYDFHGYKEGTLQRRIGRRMALHHIDGLAAYLQFLESDPIERTRLLQDLLISVTSFFRNPEAFDALAKEVLPKRLRNKTDDESFRVWVAACATGEEAYSLAILLTLQLEKTGKNCALQIFASDIDERALATARRGVYPASVIEDLPPSYRRFFAREGSWFRIDDSIRKTISFAHHDLLSSPPFSNLDLVSCRNLLIYMKPELQKKIFQLFQYALVEGGYLFLGNTEKIDANSDLFQTINSQWRLYRRLTPSAGSRMGLPITPRINHLGANSTRTDSPSPSRRKANHLTDFTQRLILDNYAPAAVVVNQNFRIRYYQGRTDRYLQRPSGLPTDDLLSQAREGLQLKLRTALHKALSSDQRVSVRKSHVNLDEEEPRSVQITVEPIRLSRDSEKLLVVIFQDNPVLAQVPPPTESDDADEQLARQLEYELRVTRDELQATIDDLADSNEDLKSANEEVTATNEELQSTNEELETSKEELQSLNEELHTINHQLQHKVQELESLYDDINNLMASSEVATLFLDKEGHIRLFTPAIRKLFNLIDSDTGRPISDISHHIENMDLLNEAKVVLKTLQRRDREVRTGDNRWFLQRLGPYRTEKDQIDGVVVNYIDITDIKEKAFAVDRLAAVVRDSNDAVAILDLDGTILEWNRGAEQTYGYSKDASIGASLLRLVPENHIDSTRDMFRRLAKGEFINSFTTQRIRSDGEILDVWLTITPLRDDHGSPRAIAVTERDVTDTIRYRHVMEAAVEEAEQANRQKSEFLAAASHDLRQPLQSLSFINASLLRKVENEETRELVEDQGEVLDAMRNVLETLLDLSQLDAGAVKPTLTEFSVDELFDSLKTEFVESASQKGLEFRIRGCSARICSDRNLLERILHNLVANAIKYSNEGKILVGCHRQGAKLRIAIYDTGCGIDSEQLQAIFNEFYQLDNPARERGKGLGLGLAICKRLARILNHRIDVTSSKGRGSVFSIEVPLVDRGGRRRQRNLAQPQATGLAGDVLIFLVDDDEAVQLSLSRYLAEFGFRVQAAGNGDEALKMVNETDGKPDLIMSDYWLPGSDNGFSLIEKIRGITGADTPAILLTGDTNRANSEKAEGAGINLLHKPVDPKHLVKFIRLLLGHDGQEE